MEFIPFPKISRLSRKMLITEKLDGTNASVHIYKLSEIKDPFKKGTYNDGRLLDGVHVRVGSRNRFLTREEDNYGFCNWVFENINDIVNGLGYGSHYGEWWGRGIQRGYDLDEKRFSLFNTTRWLNNNYRPKCCHVVPLLYEGEFDTTKVEVKLKELQMYGSYAVPGYMRPEGVVIFHEASRTMFKKTIEQDETGKEVKQTP